MNNENESLQETLHVLEKNIFLNKSLTYKRYNFHKCTLKTSHLQSTWQGKETSESLWLQDCTSVKELEKEQSVGDVVLLCQGKRKNFEQYE